MLGYFKYRTLIAETFSNLMAQLEIDYTAPELTILLPVGISFYTFQTLFYTIDVDLRRSKPETSFLDFALFVTFFPQMVAGPIVRPYQLVPQFKQPRTANRQQFTWRLFLFTWGLFQKSVLADGVLSPVVGDTFNAMKPISAFDAWLGVLAFSGQIFFDFAVYSLCAIGIAMFLGFSIPNNFKSPYAAIGFSNFWQRWHISLSGWLRDYLYIPLGGNRKGPRRTYINLMLTMFLGGIWHGASWRFLIWGGVHGLYLVTERLLKKTLDTKKLLEHPLAAVLSGLATFVCVSLTWFFCRQRLGEMYADVPVSAGTASRTAARALHIPHRDDQTVFIGASRIQFGLIVNEWERQAGVRPLLLAWPGSPPGLILHELAKRKSFKGTVICGIAPPFPFVSPEFPVHEWTRRNLEEAAILNTSLAFHLPYQAQQFLKPRFLCLSDGTFSPITILYEHFPIPNREGLSTPLIFPNGATRDGDMQMRFTDEMEASPMRWKSAKRSRSSLRAFKKQAIFD